jgi:hypothetical protein
VNEIVVLTGEND